MSVPGKTGKQLRKQRVKAELPISVDGTAATTRDVSASGVYLVQDSRPEMGSRIDFSMDLDTPGGKLKLCFEGAVVRVEELDGRFGIGINILKQEIKSVSEVSR